MAEISYARFTNELISNRIRVAFCKVYRFEFDCQTIDDFSDVITARTFAQDVNVAKTKVRFTVRDIAGAHGNWAVVGTSDTEKSSGDKALVVVLCVV